MKTKVKKAILFLGLILVSVMFSGCKNNDPSVLKIFVRSSSNELVNGAQVVIVGDVNSNPATLAYVDTLATNASGFVEFNMDTYFTMAGEGNSTGYFDVIVKNGLKTGTEYVRCRSHITTVQTVYLMN